MGSLGLPSIGSENELQDILKRIPSTANLNNDPASPSEKRSAMPRVASLDVIKAYLNSRQQQGTPTLEARKLDAGTNENGAKMEDSPQLQPQMVNPSVPVTLPADLNSAMGMQLAAAAAAAAAASGNPHMSTNPQDYLAAAFFHSQLAAQQAAAAGHMFPMAGDAASMPASHLLVPTAGLSDGPRSGQSSGGHAFPTESGAQTEREGHRGTGGNGGEPGDRQMERKQRRMLSNRESARRSRKRKQDHVAELEVKLARVSEAAGEAAARAGQLGATVAAQEERIRALIAENEALHAKLAAGGGGAAVKGRKAGKADANNAAGDGQDE